MDSCYFINYPIFLNPFSGQSNQQLNRSNNSIADPGPILFSLISNKNNRHQHQPATTPVNNDHMTKPAKPNDKTSKTNINSVQMQHNSVTTISTTSTAEPQTPFYQFTLLHSEEWLEIHWFFPFSDHARPFVSSSNEYLTFHEFFFSKNAIMAFVSLGTSITWKLVSKFGFEIHLFKIWNPNSPPNFLYK